MLGSISTLEKIVNLRFSRSFETFVVVIITASALLAGVKTFDAAKNYESIFYWTDLAVTFLFVGELLIRFAALKFSVKKFFSEGWNVFDFVVVSVSLVPISDSDLVVVARILRLFRILRMISILPDLRFLIGSFVASIPRLLHIALLLFIVFYMYGVIGSTLFAKTNPFLWSDVGTAMLTLFRVMTFEDWTDVLYEVQATYWWAWIYFLSFIFFASFAFLNMLIGVMVSVMGEQEQIIKAENQSGHADDFLGATDSEKLLMLYEQNEQLLKIVSSLPSVDEKVVRGEEQRKMMLEGLENIRAKVESMTKPDVK